MGLSRVTVRRYVTHAEGLGINRTGPTRAWNWLSALDFGRPGQVLGVRVVCARTQLR